MGNRFAVLVTIAALGAMPAALLAGDQWQIQTGPGFTVELPGKPVHSTPEATTGGGTKYKMHQYLVELDERAYAVHTAVYPADVDVSKPRVNLQGGLDKAEKNMKGGKWIQASLVKYQGYDASQGEGITDAGYSVRTFGVLKGNTIYALTYSGPPGTTKSADVERFFNSLRFK
jgi:hypothetical protein